MAGKSHKKFSDNSLRRPEWDYCKSAAYFVTICTKNRIPYFGESVNGILQLSEIGTIACKYWIEIPNHFGFIELDTFIIMPDHVHGIIIIKNNKANDNRTIDITEIYSTSVGTPKLGVPTMPDSINPTRKPNWKSNSLGLIINQYKRICTIDIRKINPDFSWQSRYHDRVIRDCDEYYRIRNYILENPLNK
ncbi:MAG: hypothetical protein JW965_00350 [Bacteroidales bacterium]|nr:hypothetical protein [Bacteroidales bacterium]